MKNDEKKKRTLESLIEKKDKDKDKEKRKEKGFEQKKKISHTSLFFKIASFLNRKKKR